MTVARAWLPTSLSRGIAGLDPGYAACVMATGIVSEGFALLGQPELAAVLLVATEVVGALLLAGYVWRLIAFPQRARADAKDPGRAFGFFSVVAAANVLGARLALDGHLLATAVLALASGVVWLVLTYVVPGAVVVGRAARVLPSVNGSWFLWCVATQSGAVVVATIGTSWPDSTSWAAPLAVGLWCVGTMLYLLLAALVTLRLLDVPVTPHALSPNYWVYMGATAISLLAAARILLLPAGVPVLTATRQVVSGLGFLLWAFGTWCIPPLLALGVWRHLIGREPIRYDPGLWSMVFPLGMYAVASASYGRVTGLDFMVDIAQGEIWVGFAAWLGVVLLLARSLLGFASGHRRGSAQPQGRSTPGRRVP